MSKHTEPPALEAGVALVFRRAARLAGSEQVALEHVAEALTGSCDEDLPPTTVRIGAELRAVLARAGELAADDGSSAVALTHLRAAVVEANVTRVGLDLGRLRFVRWRIAASYDATPGARVCLASELDTERH